MTINRYLPLIFFFFSVTICSQPVEDPSFVDTLSVKRALHLAKQKSPKLQKLAQSVNQKKAELRGNSGLSDPVLSYSREGMGNSSFSSYDEQRLGITQEIVFPITTSRISDRISSEIEALQLEYENALLLLREEIKKTYSQLQYGLELLHLAQSELEISKGVYEAVKLKYDSGEATKIELLKAKIQVNEAENSISEAQNYLHQSRYSLFNQIGLETTNQKYSINFPDTLYYKKTEISQSDILSTFYDMPGVRSKKKLIEAAENHLRVAEAGYFPNISLNLFGQDFGSGFKALGFEVGLSLPLWFQSNQRSVIDHSISSVKISDENYREELLLMKKEVEIAWHGYESAGENLNRFANGILAESEELLNLTTQGYKLGEIDFLTLLEARRTYLTSSKRYYDYLLDYNFRLIELEKFSPKEFLYND
ncbi:MAG: TolC family protein [Bacteroidetes bacterium]|nr:TolC family protein [Bacteroidota bacterium]